MRYRQCRVSRFRLVWQPGIPIPWPAILDVDVVGFDSKGRDSKGMNDGLKLDHADTMTTFDALAVAGTTIDATESRTEEASCKEEGDCSGPKELANREVVAVQDESRQVKEAS